MRIINSQSLTSRRPFRWQNKQPVQRTVLTIMLLSLLLSVLSACGGSVDPRVQQQASQNRTTLAQKLKQAQEMGVPSELLQPVQKQKQTLDKTNAPVSLFNEQPTNDYYHNLSIDYQRLKVQLQGITQVTTEQYQQKAQADLETLQHSIASQQDVNVPLDTIKQLHDQNQDNLQKAHDPKDFLAISNNAQSALATLNQMPATVEKLQSLSQIITILQGSNQDVTTLQKQYDDDKSTIAKASTTSDLKQANQSIDTQNQQVATQFNQLIPQLTKAKVDDLDGKVQQLKKYGIDTGTYQQKLDDDRTQMSNVTTLQQYMDFSKKVDGDVASMHTDLLKGQASSLLQQFHTEVDSWGNAHLYLDKFDGKSYALDGGYMAKGIGEDLDKELNASTTADDYQQTTTDVQNAAFHLQLFEADATDTAAYSQAHNTDLQLMDHYKLRGSKVIVVSFIEQALRYYENGQLVRSFLVTAGRPELPPVPGLWPVLWRQTKTTFKSPYPKGSPFWYEDTPINFAIMYHTGGYFLHDSWWRNDYGPGTQFFHADSSGNTSANYGTHGCVNMPTTQAEWLYNATDYKTQILMY